MPPSSWWRKWRTGSAVVLPQRLPIVLTRNYERNIFFCDWTKIQFRLRSSDFCPHASWWLLTFRNILLSWRRRQCLPPICNCLSEYSTETSDPCIINGWFLPFECLFQFVSSIVVRIQFSINESFLPSLSRSAQIASSRMNVIMIATVCRTTTQAVSSRSPTAAARVRSQGKSCRICGGRNDTGARFS
jgi:hypothetical protein